MSSHREAPEISKDPVADNTDTYAFVSPDNPKTVTIITNYLPAGGPGRRARPSSSSATTSSTRSTSTTTVTGRPTSPTSSRSIDAHEPQHVPLQHRPDQLADRPELEQTPALHVTRIDADGEAKVLGRTSRARPATSGRARPRTTRNSRRKRSTRCRAARRCSRATQRPLLCRHRIDLRPRRPAPDPEPPPDQDAGGPLASTRCRRSTCHTIAIQVPISALTANGSVPTNVMSSNAVSACGARPAGARCASPTAATTNARRSVPGRRSRVSATPLFNEVMIPMARKDDWNSAPPGRRQRRSCRTCNIRSSPACCRSSTRGFPQPRKTRIRARAPTSSRSC